MAQLWRPNPDQCASTFATLTPSSAVAPALELESLQSKCEIARTLRSNRIRGQDVQKYMVLGGLNPTKPCFRRMKYQAMNGFYCTDYVGRKAPTLTVFVAVLRRPTASL